MKFRNSLLTYCGYASTTEANAGSKVRAGLLSLQSGSSAGLLFLLTLLGLSSCRQDMHDQPRYEAFEGSSFFADGRSVRPSIAGTIARGHLNEDKHLHTGRIGSELADSYPFAIDHAVLERGRQRYSIFCTPCHGEAGFGDGMIVERGFRRPPSLHEQRLREAPPGYIFDVITNGFGVMYDYADRIAPKDRWAIAAYIEALQLSQYADLNDAPADWRTRLNTQQETGMGVSK